MQALSPSFRGPSRSIAGLGVKAPVLPPTAIAPPPPMTIHPNNGRGATSFGLVEFHHLAGQALAIFS